MRCAKCGTEFNSPFCPNCGTAVMNSNLAFNEAEVKKRKEKALVTFQCYSWQSASLSLLS
jgi:hypothetical protein